MSQLAILIVSDSTAPSLSHLTGTKTSSPQANAIPCGRSSRFETDIVISFQVGFTSLGRLQAVKCESYINGGHCIGLTAMLTFVVANNTDCAYDVPVAEIRQGLTRNVILQLPRRAH